MKNGARPEILDSLFKAGYANLATTDSGYFGKGLYSAFEADYSYRIYCKGALLINWVAFYSAYPTIHHVPAANVNQTAVSGTAAAPVYVKK